MANRNKKQVKKPYQKSEKNNFQDKSEVKEYQKGFRAGEQTPIKGMCSKDNDYSWYVPNGQLLKDSAALPTGYPLGVPESAPTTGSTLNNTLNYRYSGFAIPGICKYNILPVLGNTEGPTDPINLAGSNLYAQLQKKSGRVPQYDMPDLMKILIGITSAYEFYQWMVRIYGTMPKYDVTNYYTPRALVYSYGADYENLQANLADFRMYINQYALRLSALPLPKDFAYVNRKLFLYDGIYRDSDVTKAQVYLFNPLGFLAYEEGTTTSGGIQSSVKFKPLDIPYWNSPTLTAYAMDNLQSNGNLMSLSDIIGYGNELLDPLRASDDIRLVTADLLNTFGAESMFAVSPISETYEIGPSFSAEVLSQIQNTTIYPALAYANIEFVENAEINAGYCVANYDWSGLWDILDVSDNVNWAIQGRYFTDTLRGSEHKWIMNFVKDSVSPEDVMVASRLTSIPAWKVSSATTRMIYPNSMMTEIVCGAEIVNITMGGNGRKYIYSAPFDRYCTVASHSLTDVEYPTVPGGTNWSVTKLTVPSIHNEMSTMLTLRAFDWAPAVGFADIEVTAGTTADPTLFSVEVPFMEYQNFAYINAQQLRNMNLVAMEGLFNFS